MNLKGLPPERFGRLSAWLYGKLAEPALAPFYDAVAAQVEKGLETHLQPGAPYILDLGAGTSALAVRLARRLPPSSVLALDESWPMLAKTRPGPPAGKAPWRLLGRGEKLPLACDGFLLVLSTLALHHWEAPGDILAEVFRVLAPGGEFWTFEPDPESSREALRTGLRRLPGPFPPDFLLRRSFRRHGFSQAEYARLVEPLVASSPFRRIHQLRSFLWLNWMILRRPGTAQPPQSVTETGDASRVAAATKPVPGT
ncbi:MAG: class I SAM-dependent methyltransferase [Acidobacteriota bacterium]